MKSLGTGITRINKEYEGSLYKPSFDISKNSICIRLPVIDIDKLNLSEEEIYILNTLKDETELSRGEIDKKLGFNKSKTLRIINNLVERNIVQKLGDGPGTTYRLK